uniref:Uncharacterized protein n=1 Tax=Physcomitrium patens TaxID=3218 RepID=A0A2K1ICM7_PHYPA|nr:hypothetical protein PHYPA_030521 [Physcomitrium patens]
MRNQKGYVIKLMPVHNWRSLCRHPQPKFVRSRGNQPETNPSQNRRRLRLRKEPIHQPSHKTAFPSCNHVRISHTPSLYMSLQMY